MSTNDELLHPVKAAILQDVLQNVQALLPLNELIDLNIVCGAFVKFKCDQNAQAFLQTCATAHVLSMQDFAKIILILHSFYDRAFASLIHFYNVTDGYDEVLSAPIRAKVEFDDVDM